MAASIEEKSSRRQVNYELNIVPFIDLMSVCIIFLLLTAVWTQVSMIQLGSSVYGKRQDDQDDSKKPPRPEVNLELLVDKRGYTVVVGPERISIPRATGDDGQLEYDQRNLILFLKGVKDKYPEKKDALIALDDDLVYENLIQGMDSLLLSGFPEVAIKTGNAQTGSVQ